MDPGAYSREIEAYLCRKNGGHLMRIVGPAFERVRAWEEAGVPLQVVVQGIDRRLERYRVARRRRPLRIEYCEADILDLFDEWRRAVGVTGTPDPRAAAPGGTIPPDDTGRAARRRVSLPAHIDRVLAQATNHLVIGESAPDIHAALERAIVDLDTLRRDALGARGAARAALIDRLTTIDRVLLSSARIAAGPALGEIRDAAGTELAPFKARMTEAAYARALAACIDRLVRERCRLPTVRFD